MKFSSTIAGSEPLEARLRICLALLLWFTVPTLASAACTAPPNLKAKLLARPSAQVHADLGNWFAARKEFDCATKSFASAARLEPTSASFSYLLGLSLYSGGHDIEALPPLQRAAQLDASDVRPHLALAAALDALKRTADAKVEWRKALAIDAESSQALDGLSQNLLDDRDYTGVVALLDRPAGGRQRSAEQSLNLGIAFARTARLDRAASVLREGLNTNPDSLPIADELALVLMLMSRTDEAYTVFDLALQKHPADQATQVLFLRALVTGHSDKAPSYAQQLLTKYPTQWEVLYLSAVLASAEGDLQRTRALGEKSVDMNPKYPDSQRLLGLTLAKLGDPGGAREHLEKAIVLGDDQPEVHYDLAKVFQSLGDKEHAAEQLRLYQSLKNAQSDKTQAAGKAEEGDQAIAVGDAVKAIALYRDAIESDRDEALLHYKLAKALEKEGDTVSEKDELRRAIALKPDLPEAQNQLGYLAARDGDVSQAESYFHAALLVSPSYVAAWINLSATLASEAKWQEAKQAVDQALVIDPDNAQARSLSQAIAAAHAGP